MRLATRLLRAVLTGSALALPLAVYTMTAPRAEATSEVVAPVGGFVMTGVELTEAQKVRVREINRRYAAARQALTEHQPGYGADDPAVRAALFRNVDAMMAEERAVLTPVQRARFDRNVAAVLARRRALRS